MQRRSSSVPLRRVDRHPRSAIHRIVAVARPSSDMLAIDGEMLGRAVRWIVPTWIAAPPCHPSGARQRLGRRLVRARRSGAERADALARTCRRLAATTDVGSPEIAKPSDFTMAALPAVAFQAELGAPLGTYRRRVRRELCGVGGDWEHRRPTKPPTSSPPGGSNATCALDGVRAASPASAALSRRPGHGAPVTSSGRRSASNSSMQTDPEPLSLASRNTCRCVRRRVLAQQRRTRSERREQCVNQKGP
jgi:hypothetical protein